MHPRSKEEHFQGDTPNVPMAYKPEVYRPSAFWRWIFANFFSQIPVPDAWVKSVHAAAKEGVLIHIAPRVSFLDFLCLDYLLKRFRFPLLRYSAEIGLFIVEPFGRGSNWLRFKKPLPESEGLRSTLLHRKSALLFMKDPPWKLQKKAQHRTDLLHVLIESQKKMAVPVLLLPQIFVWIKRPKSNKKSFGDWVVDFVLGPQEWPGRFRVLLQFLFNYQHAVLKAGVPLNLKEFIDDRKDLTDEAIAQALKLTLLSRIEREQEIVSGPAIKSPGRVLHEIMSSPRTKQALLQESQTREMPLEAIEKAFKTELDTMMSDQNPVYLQAYDPLIKWIRHKIFSGVDVITQDLETVAATARHGPIVFLPTHKSHFDYLLLNHVLYEHGISPPLIAAGINLAFWPVGFFLKKGGAFFIRRSFSGNKLYAFMMETYIRKILSLNHHLEVFIEGGRSRTGKTLPPKTGALGMIVDACHKLPRQHIHFIPVSILYDQIPESEEYRQELGGRNKQQESVAQLAKGSSVLVKNFGRVYIRFGKSISSQSLFKGVSEESLSLSHRNIISKQLAGDTMREIHRVTPITPMALLSCALLQHHHPVGPDELLSEALQFFDFVHAQGTDWIYPQDSFQAMQLRLQHALEVLIKNKWVHRSHDGLLWVPATTRFELEYPKNSILTSFAAPTLMQVSDDPTVKQHLLILFSHEFPSMQEATEPLLAAWHPHFSRVIQSGLEAAWTCLRTLRPLAVTQAPFQPKELVKECLRSGQRSWSAGEILCHESISKMKYEALVLGLEQLGWIKRNSSHHVCPPEFHQETLALEQALFGFIGKLKGESK